MHLAFTAFNGRGEEEKIQFTRNGQPVNFIDEGVTKIEAVAYGKAVVATFTTDTVSVQFGKLGLMPGIYYPRIFVYTAAKPEGTTIAGPGKEVEIELSYNA